MINRKISYIYILAAIVGMVSFFHDYTNIFAIEETAQNIAQDESHAGLKKAPANLGLNPDQFVKGDFSGYTIKDGNSNRNLAALEDADGNPLSSTNAKNMKAIKMSTFKNEAGAIWSNVSGGNYVDITAKQTLSVWLYFGVPQHTGLASAYGVGEGMAFVLQNSNDKYAAFANKNGVIYGGENMGVWGIDTDAKSNSDPSTLASSAIQNSLALEFDTNVNKSNSSGDGFDENDSKITGQHLALGYPGATGTYTLRKYQPETPWYLPPKPASYYFSMLHNDVENTTLTDGQWHHLTVIWHPEKFMLEYKFNDKNLDGSINDNMIDVKQTHITADTFGGHDALKANNNRLCWGFTSSNGLNFEPNIVAFESIPSDIEGDATSDITDITQDKTFNSDTADDKRVVNSGDDLSLNYNLVYDSGKYSWSGDTAKIDLPDDVTVTNGDPNQIVGYVTYPDDNSDPKAEPLYASEIKQVVDPKTNKNKQVLTHLIAKDLSKNAPTKAIIKIYGKANDVTSNTNVDDAHANFSSQSIIEDTQTPSFTIQKSKPIGLTLKENNVSVDTGKDADITGEVSYADKTAVTNSDVNVYATLNGTALDTFAMGDSTNLDNATSGKLDFKIPSAKLTQDSNKLTVYVMDKNGNRSTTSTVTITKSGGLSLDVGNYSFGSINQATPSSLISRRGLWKIVVNDNRKVGTKSPWYLSATTAGLHSGDVPFKGDVIFKEPTGVEENLSNNEDVSIAQGYKLNDAHQVTNVGKSWNDSEGIMLRTNGMNEIGNYSGTMDWNLSDTI